MDSAKTKQHLSAFIRWGCLVLVLLLAAGCIRPVEETPVSPTTDSTNVTINNPGQTPAITPAVPVTPTVTIASTNSINLSAADLVAIETYVSVQSGQALQPNTLEVWWQQAAINPEEIVAFSFRNPSGLRCVGVAMGPRDASGVLTVLTGGASCATELGSTALAASWLLVAQQEPISIVATIGELLNAGGAVDSATVIFPDGVPAPISAVSISNDRFLHIRTGIFTTASEIVFFGQDGTEIRRQRVIP